MDFSIIESDYKKALIAPRFLLSKFRLTDERSKELSSVQNLSFFYNLGKYIKAKNLLEIGFGLGLTSSLYLWTSNETDNFLAYQESDKYYSKRIGVNNVKQVWKKKFPVIINNEKLLLQEIQNKEWDVIFLNDDNKYLYKIWDYVTDKGHVFVNLEKDNKEICFDFCKIKRREPFTFSSGVAVIVK